MNVDAEAIGRRWDANPPIDLPRCHFPVHFPGNNVRILELWYVCYKGHGSACRASCLSQGSRNTFSSWVKATGQ